MGYYEELVKAQHMLLECNGCGAQWKDYCDNKAPKECLTCKASVTNDSVKVIDDSSIQLVAELQAIRWAKMEKEYRRFEKCMGKLEGGLPLTDDEHEFLEDWNA